jgi:cyclopropane fatty-acyl-phospholipid synthase-like methyltransferase
MKKILLRLINPVVLFKAWIYHKNNSKYDKSTYDLELFLYSKILKNDMLHYGYFDNPDLEADSISIAALEEAQIRYAQNIIDQIVNPNDLILDIGCGMGGLSNLMVQKGLKVEALTPNENQIRHIKSKYPSIPCYQKRFEDFDTNNIYGTIINSESLQYIPLSKAFEKAREIVKTGGTWIIADYFRFNNLGINKSSHLLEDFIKTTEEYGWEITYQQDITSNILPTIKLVYGYAERFLLPLTHFVFEKVRFKKAWLYYIIKDFKLNVDQKISKELAAVDPVRFKDEKKYMLIVLRKKT